jgi:hypothetical protein
MWDVLVLLSSANPWTHQVTSRDESFAKEPFNRALECNKQLGYDCVLPKTVNLKSQQTGRSNSAFVSAPSHLQHSLQPQSQLTPILPSHPHHNLTPSIHPPQPQLPHLTLTSHIQHKVNMPHHLAPTKDPHHQRRSALSHTPDAPPHSSGFDHLRKELEKLAS